MQHVPSGMFQELQQQGESQAEEPSGGSGAEAAGRRGLHAPRSTTRSPSPGLLAGPGIIRASSSSPFFSETTGPLRESPQEGPGRGERGNLAVAEETTLERQRPRPRPSTSPSWQSSSEAVPPQLLGGRTGTNASVLTSTPESVARYKSSRKQSTTAHLQSLLASASSTNIHPTPPVATLLETSRSGISRHSTSSISSISSESSYASSYAYSLRRSEPDLRLLRKRSKPSQHLLPQSIIKKQPLEEKRSTPFYSPKVVEDTGVVESPTKHITPPPPARPICLTLPDILPSEPPIAPLRKRQTFGLQSNKYSSQSLTNATRPLLLRSADSQKVRFEQTLPLASPGPARQLRFETPTAAELSPATPGKPAEPHARKRPTAIKIDKPTFDLKEPPKHHRNQQLTDVSSGMEQDFLTHKFLHPGDSYFSTFAADSLPNKEFVPIRTPRAIDGRELRPKTLTPTAKWSIEQETSVPQTPTTPVNQPEPLGTTARKRKSSAFFGFFRKASFKNDVFGDKTLRDGVKSGKDSSPLTKAGVDAEQSSHMVLSSAPHTPGIMISSPANTDSSKQRQTSVLPELQAASYFAGPQIGRGDSEGSYTPSPGASPMASIEDVRGTSHATRLRIHHRSSSSEQLSPMALPGKRVRMKHRSTLSDSSDQSEALPAVGCTPAGRAYTSAVLPSSDARPAADERTKEDILHNVPEQHRELGKKSSLFGELLKDIRKVSSLHHLPGMDDTAHESNVFRHPRHSSLMPKVSLPRLNIRASRSSVNVRNRKLVKKRSMAIQQMQEELDEEHAMMKERLGQDKPTQDRPTRRITATDLEVTDFYQTPFSKRYYDSKRAAEQAIKAFIEENIDEDDEEDDETVLGFEQDVPDHLPSSPLCPLHPKHKSGGKAICPMHRKYKKRKPPARNSTHKVEIVFDLRDELVKQRTASMGIDGAETISSGRVDGYETPDQFMRKQSKQRDSEVSRGRRRERGECALERRRNRRKKRRV